jgi:hypothetical protein
MSLEIPGNNSYDGVPLIDTAVGTWAEGANRCNPLFRNLAIAGLSALCDGIRCSSESSVLNTLEFEELFDESGKFVGNALSRRVSDGWHSTLPHVDRFVAGIHIMRAALTASRLFDVLSVIDEDYVGSTGMDFLWRRVVLPVSASNAYEAGTIMNSGPVRDIQTRVFAQQRPDSDSLRTELDFAAGLYGPGSLPRSIATSLSSDIDLNRQSVSARVVSGERQGDFVHCGGYTDFDDLSRYARVVDGIL